MKLGPTTANVLLSVSLVLSLALIYLLIRSYLIGDIISYSSLLNGQGEVESADGDIGIYFISAASSGMSTGVIPQGLSYSAAFVNSSPHWWQRIGTSLVTPSSQLRYFRGSKRRGFSLPHWVLIALDAAIILYCLRIRASYMSNAGSELRCSRCGYDLRATPDRCPECGAEAHPA